MNKISIGFSPCPNDTFIFDALVNGKIDTGNLQFEPVLEDVETLNRWAASGKLAVTKLSLPALFKYIDKYQILDSGAALGLGVGPLLIAKNDTAAKDVSGKTIAIPGVHTTANFLLSFAFPDAQQRSETLFSQIEDQVVNSKTELGVLIHENRFTYEKRGLKKVLDLGAYWEEQTGAPIPLGIIAVRRDVPLHTARNIQSLIAKSLQWAWAAKEVSPYVKAHAQAMDPQVMQQHIDLYVNDYSLSLGVAGRNAIELMYRLYKKEIAQKSNEERELFLRP